MNEKISVYENIKEVKNGYTITVKTALDRIKTGKSKELLLDIRKAKTKKEKNALKANLPSVTFSGTFTERNDESLKEASGYMVLDFDDVKSVEAKKKELSNNSYVFACWESPSGNGVKALIKIANPKKFKEHFKEVEKEFKGIDPSGKNISRVCYESFDPDIYINQNAKVFSKVPQQDGYTVKNWDSVNKALRKIEDSIEGEKHDVRIRISYLFGGWVASGEMTYDDAHRLLINAVLKNTEDPELAIKDVEDSLREGMKSPCSMTKQNEILSMRVGVGKLWVTMTDVAKEVEEFQRKGYERGESCGFSSADDYISFLPSAVTYIYGAPYSGKSNFTHEVCMNLSESKGWKWVLLTPETGTPAQVYGELMSIKAKKSFVAGGVVDQEAARFVRDHFIVLDTKGAEFYLKDFCNQVEGIERELNIKINGTVIDPHNYLDFDLNLREDRAIGKDLDLMLADARKNARHNILVTHVRDQQLRFIKDNQGQVSRSYYPAASPREIQYGQIFFRKGMQMISAWRPLDIEGEPLPDSTGVDYDSNETHFIVHKSKPKGIGKTGTFKLWYDVDKNRYYEKAANGEPKYAFGNVIYNPNKFIEPSVEFEDVPEYKEST